MGKKPKHSKSNKANLVNPIGGKPVREIFRKKLSRKERIALIKKNFGRKFY
ncbi:MAG: hypothetical protein AB1467_04520 [Candidatus Diapherotrites archaeon]